MTSDVSTLAVKPRDFIVTWRHAIIAGVMVLSIAIDRYSREARRAYFAIARDELKSVTVQLHGSSASPPLTPKEEEQSKIQELEKYMDLLGARLQLSKARVSLLRQTGQLDPWLRSQEASPAGP